MRTVKTSVTTSLKKLHIIITNLSPIAKVVSAMGLGIPAAVLTYYRHIAYILLQEYKYYIAGVGSTLLLLLCMGVLISPYTEMLANYIDKMRRAKNRHTRDDYARDHDLPNVDAVFKHVYSWNEAADVYQRPTTSEQEYLVNALVPINCSNLGQYITAADLTSCNVTSWSAPTHRDLRTIAECIPGKKEDRYFYICYSLSDSVGLIHRLNSSLCSGFAVPSEKLVLGVVDSDGTNHSVAVWYIKSTAVPWYKFTEMLRGESAP